MEVLTEHATVDGDILELGAHTWAIHGSVAVDGEIILAEFGTEREAQEALTELSRIERDLGTD